MAEFEEKSNGNEVVEVDTCDSGSEVRKTVHGVSKYKNKWVARVRHPKLKFTVHMGLYDSHEEAALVVKKTKAEFQEMLKGDSSTNVKTRRDVFEGRRLPHGVRRKGYRSWSTQIYHPGLKRKITVGSYKTPVEASIAVENKRNELLKKYGYMPVFENGCKTDDDLLEGLNHVLSDDLKERAGVSKLRAKVKHDCKFNDEVVEDPKRDVVTRLENRVKLTNHLKGPRGMRKMKSSKWGVRIAGRLPECRMWLDTFNNVEEAVRSYNKDKAELAAKREKNSGSINRCPTLILGSDKLNKISINDESNIGLSIADVPDNPENTFVQRLPISNFEPENADSAAVSERTMIMEEIEQRSGCVSEFDEAMSLRIINEYGQLVGMYSKLDEEMEFSLPGEDVTDTGWY